MANETRLAEAREYAEKFFEEWAASLQPWESRSHADFAVAVMEACCKDVCRYCRGGEAFDVSELPTKMSIYGWVHVDKRGEQSGWKECDAAAIRERWAGNGPRWLNLLDWWESRRMEGRRNKWGI